MHNVKQFEAHKNDWLVQSIEDGEAVDHEMFKPNEKEKALDLVKELRKDGINAKVVHPCLESF